eukprot:gene11995-biopygen536
MCSRHRVPPQRLFRLPNRLSAQSMDKRVSSE